MSGKAGGIRCAPALTREAQNADCCQRRNQGHQREGRELGRVESGQGGPVEIELAMPAPARGGPGYFCALRAGAPLAIGYRGLLRLDLEEEGIAVNDPDFVNRRRLWLFVLLALGGHWLHHQLATLDLYRFDALASTLM